MSDKYITLRMTMRMKDATIKEFPTGLMSLMILEIFQATQKVAAPRGVWIIGGGTEQPDDLLARLIEACTELLEVADLRGDTTLLNLADDPILWIARIQEAWDILREVLNGPPSLELKNIETVAGLLKVKCPGYAGRKGGMPIPCPESQRQKGCRPGGDKGYPEDWDKDCPTCGSKTYIFMEAAE